jgi:hypothetical protein
MYDNTVEEWTTGEGYRVRVKQDYDPMDPREWDNLGTMICWHGRYTLGDKNEDYPEPSDFLQDMAGIGAIALPLYLYDHSGLTMSTAPFSCPWDSGQVGFIYTTPSDLEEAGISQRADEDEDDFTERVKGYLRGEVETYDQYLRGEVFYFVVENPVACDHGDTHYEMVDSCGGFFGYDDAITEVQSQWPPLDGVA